MKKLLLSALLCLPYFAQAAKTTIQTTYQTLAFEHSKKKEDGKRVGLHLTHKEGKQCYAFAYEQTETKTFKPPMKEDLNVHKYAFKYSYFLDKTQTISGSFLHIDDNLMRETDGGNIYGLAYRYCAFGIAQYLSDYPHFDVYQTDFTYHKKRNFGKIKAQATLMLKYLHLSDKNSNNFSKNAKENYLTPALKVHLHRGGYHLGAAIFLGKRVFGVMQEGFVAQHHAMEFDETYMVGLSKDFGTINAKIKYSHQSAEEIPVHNKNVKVDTIALQLKVTL